jgi:two-component system chemotaxis response regulator CheB
MPPIRVAIVDDSAFVRQVLTALLEADGSFEVVGTAADPYEARDLIKATNPDVLTLDVEMPRMDGLTFLGNLMRLRPVPTVMVSTLTEHGADATLRALELGAVDYVPKPTSTDPAAFHAVAADLVEKLKVAAGARIRMLPAAAPRPAAARPIGGTRPADFLLAIGASTGGTEAIREVLTALPAQTPGTVIAQHIPAMFSRRFAERLNDCCAMRVKEAEDGEPILTGHAYVAPGGFHLVLQKGTGRWLCRLTRTEPVHRQRPAVDVLFDSVAKLAGANALGVVLTGMGADGGAGLLAMREAGAHTIAQDQASSVVWGMPGTAVKLGAAEEVLPLGKIAGRLQRLFPGSRAA